jgi:protein-disulfide isomerase
MLMACGRSSQVAAFRRFRMAARRPLILRSSSLALALALAVGLGALAPACRAQDDRGDVVATVGDRTITLAELDRRWAEAEPASWAQVRQGTYDARRRVLDAMIEDDLIDLEARKRGISKERLLETELAGRIRPITQEEIAALYQSMGERAGGATLAQLTPAIRQHLEEQRPVQARQALVADLRRASTAVRTMLAPPRLQVTTAATDPALGPAGAPVEIVEFSDFQCPFCQRAAATVQKVRAAFGDRVRLVFKDFPLSTHPDAFAAAEAAQCAREQGKFWEYHDRLFANQQALGRGDLKRYAVQLGLDAARFDACLNEDRLKYLVQADVDESQRYGVSSTPTFFINGRLLSGALPFEVFEQVVREELAAGAAAADGTGRSQP